MASQIAHIVYAKKYLEKYSQEFDEKEFIVGCLFPDIRRMDARISRRETHLCFYPLDLSFEKLNSFQAGWKFHLYCDMRREEILNNYHFYSIKNTDAFYNQSAKMLEDEVVYDCYDNWQGLSEYFNFMPMLSTGIDIQKETFESWYSIVAEYIKEKPSSKSIENFLSKQPTLASESKELVVFVDKLRKNGKVIELLKKVKEEII
ncbi:MAG: hypothetical protein Q7S18_01350 [bacterium]|nr:hypothetical protein [bacterium]